MGLFSHILKANDSSVRTTRGFIIGVVEAEGEVHNKNILLNDVFVDYPDLIWHLDNGKFIILGRKGMGKSAVGEYLISMTHDQPNQFATMVSHHKIELEKLIQHSYQEHSVENHSALFKWVVLTQILNLMTENEHIQHWEEMDILNKFLKRNRGFVGIDKYEIYDHETAKGFSINIEYLKRLCARLGIDVKEKGGKAIYYKMLPDLEQTMVKLMKKDEGNDYLLIIDDLDIEYKNKQENNDMLVDLLRVVKYYNNDVFAQNNLSTRIIVLLRDDISRHIMNYADTSKIINSYAFTLRWYQENISEDKLLLKQFINKRIEHNFKRLAIEYDRSDPWSEFVEKSKRGEQKSSFKYILDQTFYRPRDLVLLFNDIGSKDIPLPISHKEISRLIARYSKEMIGEIKNELSSQLSDREIDDVLKILYGHGGKRETFSYDELIRELQEAEFYNPVGIMEMLFDYSLIGNKNEKGGFNFKFREREGHVCEMNKHQDFVLHNIIKKYASINHGV
ncbi:MAG: hypothetical protein IJ804_04845 [Prevotella sp.]|nr:hypothetical protein [Prevotella sp.]